MGAGQSKAVCFGCRYVEADASLRPDAARCPRCGYPLILNTASVALATEELDVLFRLLRSPFMRQGEEGLPGIAEPRRKREPRRTPPGVRVVEAPAPAAAAAQRVAPRPAQRSAAAPGPAVDNRPAAARIYTPRIEPEGRPTARTARLGTPIPRPRVLDARRPTVQSRRRWLLA